MAKQAPPASSTGPSLPAREVLAALRKLRRGEFDARLPDGHAGVEGQLCEAFNDIAEQLQSLTEELGRVSAEVGAGETSRRLALAGPRGGWRRAASSVNAALDALTEHARALARASAAAAAGDFSQRVDAAGELRGELGRDARAVDGMLGRLAEHTEALVRVAEELGREGGLGAPVRLPGARGAWKALEGALDAMSSGLGSQVRALARAAEAVARGELGGVSGVEVRGELRALQRALDAALQQLGAVAGEVARVTREVSVEGRLGGHAEPRGAAGAWKGLVDDVNQLAGSLTTQVRDLAQVTTAVARGDLSRKVTIDVRGEILDVKTTINAMVDQLSIFAAEIVRVSRGIGVEGVLGGRVEVRGVAGVWQDMVENVNFLAASATEQVRGIARVVTAVARGDLSQQLEVAARGEIAALRDSLNATIRTLAETTRVNEEQDWLKTNLTRFTRMLQGQRDLSAVARDVLWEIAPSLGAQAGAFYMAQTGAGGEVVLRRFAGYACAREAPDLAFGEGLVGQAAALGRTLAVDQVPPGYMDIASGLGAARPLHLVVVPVLFEGEVKGVVELAALQPFGAVQRAFLEQFQGSLGIVIASIEAQMRTDELLRRSQELAEELQSQQDELRQTNEELERRARELWAQKSEVERKNQEALLVRRELEEKAEQLARTSKYKSQFLANMSHELRTPLNSLLILSRQLADNRPGNLDARQVQYARTIHQAGADLLELINEILDLAKIESGTMHVELGEVGFDALREHVERTFSHVAEDKRLAFAVEVAAGLPDAIVTDEMRLKQVLRNLLSNAFKFTERGEVTLTVRPLREVPGLAPDPAAPDEGFVAFAVRDSGIGIAPDQQRLIFEAFQQADGTETRKYGGTGLGLAISREIAALLGGDVRVESRPGEGSTFTLYLPRVARARPRAAPAARTPEPTPPRALRDPAPAPTEERAAAPAGERMLLVVADDDALARTLVELARTRGFHGVIAGSGAQALELVQKLVPDAIALHLELADMDGWVLLDRLTHDPRTQHVPVHVISAQDQRRRALEQGALGCLVEPVGGEALLAALAEAQSLRERPVRRALIVESDAARRAEIAALIGGEDVACAPVDDVSAAVAALGRERFDLVVIGESGLGLLAARADAHPPIVAYTAAELEPQTSGPIVTHARAPEQLVEASALHLHRADASLSPAQRELLQRARMNPPALAGRTLLVVDDDVRNIFTLTAVLEHHGMRVVYAENGREALERLAQRPEVALVLMDIMMPEMDGYEATRRIRARGDAPPVVALTARAMQGDREKCLRAGAVDYIAKPVDPDQLVSVLRVRLRR